MRRREFITLLGGAAVALPCAARAQDAGRIRKIGILMNLLSDDREGQARIRAFAQALQKHGWIERETCASKFAGPATTPSAITSTQRNWSGLPRT
jgi:hypothetical protein